MTSRLTGIDKRCLGCRINNNLCVCEYIHPVESQNLISLVVHVNELKLTSNTPYFVNKLLPNQANIYIRGRVNEVFDAAPIMERPGYPIFLYPTEDAIVLDEDFKQKFPGPYHLIVPDGNWHQARRVKKREEAFKPVQSVKLPEGIVGEYLLRRAPQPEWLSTFEAVAHALGILERVDLKNHMITFFRHWVKTTIQNRKYGC